MSAGLMPIEISSSNEMDPPLSKAASMSRDRCWHHGRPCNGQMGGIGRPGVRMRVAAEDLCYMTSTRSNASITTVPISSDPRMRWRKAVTSVGWSAPKWYSSMAPSGWFATRSQPGSTVPQSLQRTSLPESIRGHLIATLPTTLKADDVVAARCPSSISMSRALHSGPPIERSLFQGLLQPLPESAPSWWSWAPHPR